MCAKCAMNRCATMQSVLLRYLSCKCLYMILSMIMMPKEGIVCFILFLHNKNIWFCEKIKSLSQLLRNYIGTRDSGKFFAPPTPPTHSRDISGPALKGLNNSMAAILI